MMWSWISFLIGIVVGVMLVFVFAAISIDDKEKRWWE